MNLVKRFKREVERICRRYGRKVKQYSTRVGEMLRIYEDKFFPKFVIIIKNEGKVIIDYFEKREEKEYQIRRDYVLILKRVDYLIRRRI